MNILFIQWAGNYKDAYENIFVSGNEQTFYGQKYTVEFVSNLAKLGHTVKTITVQTSAHNVELAPNLFSTGLPAGENYHSKLWHLINEFKPHRAIVRFPDAKILAYLRKCGVPVLPAFADSFEKIKIWKVRGFWQRAQLSSELKHNCIRWVGNHQINAAKSLVSIGVQPEKVLAYDWVHDDGPENWTKVLPQDISKKTLRFFYAGGINRAKGLYDVIDAIKLLKKKGREAVLRVAGRGSASELEAYVKSSGLTDNVTNLGLVSHSTILKEMNASDFVLVASRHSYPEGLPMTIMESLMTHTPVIASDHPMFVGRVGTMGSVKFFKAASPSSLADVIISSCSDPKEYQMMCENAPEEWRALVLDLKWAEMVKVWIEDPEGADFSEYNYLNVVEA